VLKIPNYNIPQLHALVQSKIMGWETIYRYIQINSQR